MDAGLIERMFVMMLFALGILVIGIIMIIMINATALEIRKMHERRMIHEAIKEKIEKGEFHVVGCTELDDLENENTDS